MTIGLYDGERRALWRCWTVEAPESPAPTLSNSAWVKPVDSRPLHAIQAAERYATTLMVRRPEDFAHEGDGLWVGVECDAELLVYRVVKCVEWHASATPELQYNRPLTPTDGGSAA